MFTYVCFGSNDLDRSAAFYDAVLAPLGLSRCDTSEEPDWGGVIGWGIHGHLPPDFVAQVRQTLRNIAAILAEGGAKPEHLVRLTWYVVDMDEYLASLKALGQIYREVFGAHYPAMALVQVVRLVEKEAKVEIEATAVVPR